jgi:hypothetical protein
LSLWTEGWISDKPLTPRKIIALGNFLGARTKEASLVLCLVLIASATAVASEHLVPPVFGVKIEPIVAHGAGNGTSPGSKSKFGTLLIEATSNMRFTGGVFPVPFLSGIKVLVLAAGPDPLLPTAHETNSTGGLELQLPPANYSVSFFGLPMNASVPALVYQGETTVIQLVVTGDTYQTLYLSMPANQTDAVPAWTTGAMEVGSPIAMSGVSATFLDLYYNTTAGTPTVKTQLELKTPVQVPLLVTGSDVRLSVGTGATFGGPPADEWITFQPETSLSLAGLISAGVSVYSVSVNVTTAASIIPVGGIGNAS